MGRAKESQAWTQPLQTGVQCGAPSTHGVCELRRLYWCIHSGNPTLLVRLCPPRSARVFEVHVGMFEILVLGPAEVHHAMDLRIADTVTRLANHMRTRPGLQACIRVWGTGHRHVPVTRTSSNTLPLNAWPRHLLNRRSIL